MATKEAHNKASIEYNKRQDNIMIRPSKGEGIRIRTAAKQAGLPLQRYILNIVRNHMDTTSKIDQMDMSLLNDIEVPSLFNANGQKVELNYHEMCSLLVVALKDDPNLNDEQRKSILATVLQLHDLLIDLSW